LVHPWSLLLIHVTCAKEKPLHVDVSLKSTASSFLPVRRNGGGISLRETSIAGWAAKSPDRRGVCAVPTSTSNEQVLDIARGSNSRYKTKLDTPRGTNARYQTKKLKFLRLLAQRSTEVFPVFDR
jgi:hypothetical protein